MPKLTKNKRDLIVLGVLLLAIAGALIWLLSGGAEEPSDLYQPKKIDTVIKDGIFGTAEFRRLRPNVDLPLEPGAKGRENPFAPYGIPQP